MMGRWEMVLGVTDTNRWRQLLDEGFEPFAVAYTVLPDVLNRTPGAGPHPIVSFRKFYAREDDAKQ